MISEYDILMGKEVVGTAKVERQGLYYRFVCRCKLSGAVMCRVMVSCNGHHENLGILMPCADGFALTAKLAAKKMAKGKWVFRVLPKHQSSGIRFIPVYPEEPFAYLSRLKNAFLEVQHGQVGVVIMDAPGMPVGREY